MPVLVTEDWTLFRRVLGVSVVRVFDISGATSDTEALAELLTQTGGPGVGVGYGQTWPEVLGSPVPLAVQEGGIAIEPKGRMRRVTVTYSRGTLGTTSLFPSQKWEVEVEEAYEEYPLVRDGAGRLIVSGAREPIETGLVDQQPYLIIRLTREEVGDDVLSKNETYRRRVNSAPVTLPKFGAQAAGTIMLESVKIAGGFRSGDPKVPVRYTFIRKWPITAYKQEKVGGSWVTETIHGFRHRVSDVMTRAYRDLGSSTKELAPIVWKTTKGTERHSSPGYAVLGNGRGKPINAQFGVAVITGSGGAAVIDAVDAIEFDEKAPVHFLTSPAGTAPADTALAGVTLLYDASLGTANLNDLNITANN